MGDWATFGRLATLIHRPGPRPCHCTCGTWCTRGGRSGYSPHFRILGKYLRHSQSIEDRVPILRKEIYEIGAIVSI